jgi:hypothetical protein
MKLPLSAEQRGRIVAKVTLQEGGCWTGPPLVKINGERVSMMRALWCAVYGRMPVGSLTVESTCAPGCMNPHHASDAEDRKTRDELEAAYRTEGFSFMSGVQFVTERGGGCTLDFGCYSCNSRFSPLRGMSEVLCDSCVGPGCDIRRGWTGGEM